MFIKNRRYNWDVCQRTMNEAPVLYNHQLSKLSKLNLFTSRTCAAQVAKRPLFLLYIHRISASKLLYSKNGKVLKIV